MTLKGSSRLMRNRCQNRTCGVFRELCRSLGLTILVVTAAFAGQERDEHLEITRCRIGTLKGSFGIIGANDTKAAITVWARNILGVNAVTEDNRLATVFETPEEMVMAYENREIDAVIMPTQDFSKIKTRPNYVYLNYKNHSFTTKYAILVHCKSGIEDLSQLKGCNFVYYTGPVMSMAIPWTDALLRERSMGLSQQIFNSIKRMDTASKAILQVFFRKADACIVSLDTFKTACELNPQIEKEMKPLVVSPELIPIFIFLHPQFDSKSRNEVDEAFANLEKTVAGRQLLTVFQAEKLERMPVSVLDKTLALLPEGGHAKRSNALSERQALRSRTSNPGKN